MSVSSPCKRAPGFYFLTARIQGAVADFHQRNTARRYMVSMRKFLNAITMNSLRVCVYDHDRVRGLLPALFGVFYTCPPGAFTCWQGHPGRSSLPINPLGIFRQSRDGGVRFFRFTQCVPFHNLWSLIWHLFMMINLKVIKIDYISVILCRENI